MTEDQRTEGKELKCYYVNSGDIICSGCQEIAEVCDCADDCGCFDEDICTYKCSCGSGDCMHELEEKINFPHGKCECNGCLPHLQHGVGPAAFEAVRNGKKMLLCTRCDLSSDIDIRLLVTKEDIIGPYMEYDMMGAFTIMNKVCD